MTHQSDREILEHILNTLTSINKKTDILNSAVESLHQRMDAIEQRMDAMEQRIDSLEQHVDSLEQHVDSLGRHVIILDNRINALEQSFIVFRIHIENETDRNIAIIAENHLNLNRKLNEALFNSDEISLYRTALNILSNRTDKLEQDVTFLKKHTLKKV